MTRGRTITVLSLLALSACHEQRDEINANWAEWCSSHTICQNDQTPRATPAPAAPSPTPPYIPAPKGQ